MCVCAHSQDDAVGVTPCGVSCTGLLSHKHEKWSLERLLSHTHVVKLCSDVGRILRYFRDHPVALAQVYDAQLATVDVECDHSEAGLRQLFQDETQHARRRRGVIQRTMAKVGAIMAAGAAGAASASAGDTGAGAGSGSGAGAAVAGAGGAGAGGMV